MQWSNAYLNTGATRLADLHCGDQYQDKQHETDHRSATNGSPLVPGHIGQIRGQGCRSITDNAHNRVNKHCLWKEKFSVFFSQETRASNSRSSVREKLG